MQKSITRRDAIAGAGAVAGASIVALPAVAETLPIRKGFADAELHSLWNEYRKAEICNREMTAQFHAAYEDFRARWQNHPGAQINKKCIEQPLWHELGLDDLHDRCDEADRRRIEVGERIRAAKADSIFGVAVKLAYAGYCHTEDLSEAIIDALEQIDALTNENFAAFTVGHDDWGQA